MSHSENLKFTDGGDDSTHMTVMSGPFEGTTFKYGRVWFPNEEEPVLSFDYDLISTPLKFDKAAFEQYAGEVIIEILQSQIDNQEVVYSGGTGGSTE